MYDGQLLIAKAAAYSLLGPWMSRQGDYIRISAEVVAYEESAGESFGLSIGVETKNTSEATDGAPATGTNIDLNSTTASAPQTAQFSVLDELVRYKYTFTGNAAGDWIIFRMLQPVWFDAV